MLIFAGVLAGCGVENTTYSSCSPGTLTNTASSGSNFTLSAPNSILTVYPGETTTVSVNVNSVNGSTGTVNLGTTALPLGVTLTGGTAAIGSTATMTLAAGLNVAGTCFTGVVNHIETADRTLTITGSNSTGNATAQIDMNVVLENKTFLPTTNYLPVVKITTTNSAAITSEDDYVDGTMTITDTANPSYNYSGTLGIKGHGNSTWLMPKKAYRLNLDSKAPLLGMTSDSNWILLANYDDKTLLRNDVSSEISRRFSMFWTPSSTFTEVYLNGEYEGVYQLYEKVEVSKARLNIGSIDDDDISGTNLTGGYLGEIDERKDEDFIFNSQYTQLAIGLDDPDNDVDVQNQYFKTALNTAEGSLYSSNWTDASTGWQAYWDAPSAVNYFLIEEFALNPDAGDVSGDYFYKPRSDARFYRGPVWDMDITFGNVNYSPVWDPTYNYLNRASVWYARQFEDPAFPPMVKARWQAMYSSLSTINDYIDTRAAVLQQAQANNFGRWPILGEKVWPNRAAYGSYQAEVDQLKAWITQRLAHMNSVYGQ